MAMKRKRSTPSLSPPSLSPPSAPSSCPSASPSSEPPASANHDHASADSMQRFYPQSKPPESHGAIGKDWARNDHRGSSHDLGSRTMKRHRDDRPDEATVHATTLSRLYAAQRRPHLSPPATPTGAPGCHSTTNSHPPTADDAACGMDLDDAAYFPASSDGVGPGFPAQRATLDRFWGAG